MTTTRYTPDQDIQKLIVEKITSLFSTGRKSSLDNNPPRASTKKPEIDARGNGATGSSISLLSKNNSTQSDCYLISD